MRPLIPVCLLLLPTMAHAADLNVGSGQTYATVQEAVNAAQPGDAILVHDGSYTEDVDITSSGEANARITLQPADGASPTITGQMTIDGAFWDVTGLTLVARPGARGVRLRGDDNRILGVELSGGDNNGIDGGGRRNEVRDSHIHDFDAGDSDAHCIVLNPGAEDWVIAGNDIHDCSGDCLQLFSSGVETSIKNLLVENNHLYFTGAIMRTENAIDVKNGDGVVIRNNRMHSFPDNKVVVFQKGPVNIELSCNEMYDGFTGVEFRGEDGGTVQNVVFTRNVMHDFSSYALKFDGTQQADVFNNTFVAIGSDGLRIEGAGLDGGAIRNNLWVDTGNVDAGNFDASHNGYFNASTDIGGADDVTADPLLDAMYQLQDGSPMIDVGLDVGLPFVGAAPDIGWHELGADGCDVPMGGTGGSGAGVGGAGATTSRARKAGGGVGAGAGAGTSASPVRKAGGGGGAGAGATTSRTQKAGGGAGAGAGAGASAGRARKAGGGAGAGTSTSRI